MSQTTLSSNLLLSAVRTRSKAYCEHSFERALHCENKNFVTLLKTVFNTVSDCTRVPTSNSSDNCQKKLRTTAQCRLILVQLNNLRLVDGKR